MDPKPHEAVLIESALAAIEHVLARASEPAVPFHSPTELGRLPVELQQAMQQADEAAYRDRPAQSALHFCLTSASALLDVSQTLMNRPSDPSPQERERDWKALAEYTKIAGRAAYRAALILADPLADSARPATAPKTAAA